MDDRKTLFKRTTAMNPAGHRSDVSDNSSMTLAAVAVATPPAVNFPMGGPLPPQALANRNEWDVHSEYARREANSGLNHLRQLMDARRDSLRALQTQISALQRLAAVEGQASTNQTARGEALNSSCASMEKLVIENSRRIQTSLEMVRMTLSARESVAAAGVATDGTVLSPNVAQVFAQVVDDGNRMSQHLVESMGRAARAVQVLKSVSVSNVRLVHWVESHTENESLQVVVANSNSNSNSSNNKNSVPVIENALKSLKQIELEFTSSVHKFKT